MDYLLGGCRNIGQPPPPTQLKHKSREISYVYNLFLRYSVVLKFYTEYDCNTAMLCTKFQNNEAN